MARKPKVEEQEYVPDVDNTQETLKKIRLPLIWGNLERGIRIEDLKDTRYEEAWSVIEEYYLPHEVLCRSIEISRDPESVQGYKEFIMKIFKDCKSVIAVEISTDKIVGVLALRSMYKNDFSLTFFRMHSAKGKLFKPIMKIYDNAYKNSKNIYDMCECESLLSIHALCITSEYRHKKYGAHLMRTSMEIAKSMNLDGVMGIFSSGSLQQTATKMGMQTIFDIEYVRWLENYDMVFDDPGAGNYTLSVMAMKVSNDQVKKNLLN